jgi:hypothetical protein
VQELRVDTAAVRAMASRWIASASELRATQLPPAPGVSSQPSAAAVQAAHADVETFISSLTGRIDKHASGVVGADTSYIATEAGSARQLAALSDSPTVT